MMRSLGRVTRLFGALSDETRVRIVLLLGRTPLCVCELASILGYEQSRVSHSLRALKNAGLVESSREGKIIVYSIDEETAKSPFYAGFRSEVEISAEDLRRLERCKRDDVRNCCGRSAGSRIASMSREGP